MNDALCLAIYPRSVQTQILNFLMTVIYWLILDTIVGFPYYDIIPTTTHGRRNRGGGCRGAIAPPIFCQPKKIKIIKTTTYRSVYRNMAKIC